MPVLRNAKAAPQHDPMVMAELEEVLEHLGAGPLSLAAKERRRKVLLDRKRPLTDDEQDELDALTIERRTRRRYDRDLGALIATARETWAQRSGDAVWVAKWEKRAADSRRRYGSKVTAEDVHFVHAISTGAERKRIDRESERGDRIVRKIEAQREKRAERARAAAKPPTPAPVAPSRAAATVTPPLALDAPEIPDAAPHRRRIKYGIVAQFDAFGSRVE